MSSSINEYEAASDEENQKSLSMFTDGLMPNYFDETITTTDVDYENLLDRIKLKIQSKENSSIMNGQIDGIVDHDEKDTKPMVKRREFFVHSTNNYNYSTVSFQEHFNLIFQLFIHRNSMDKVIIQMSHQYRMVSKSFIYKI